MSMKHHRGTRVILKTALMCGATAVVATMVTSVTSSAQNEPKYIVTPDNRRVLGLDFAAMAAQANAVCTPETPCRYDDLPDGGVADFSLSGGVWPNTGLTYSVGPGTADLAFDSENALIAQAFGLWANVARINAAEVPAPGGMLHQYWGSGNHGDAFPFDGPGGVLAHCFYPPPVNANPIAGDCHYDDSETWVSPGLGGVGIDTVTVATHELGHGLGLQHSSDPNSIMAPFYTGRRAYLSYDDIAGIVSLYKGRVEDVIFQIEQLNTIAPGAGSFRLGEGSVKVELHQKGAAAVYQTRFMPSAFNAAPGTVADVDGVIANVGGAQFDGYWWHAGDLYRAHFTMDATRKDVDQVRLTLTITDNALTAPAVLRASMNGRVLGDIGVNPGDGIKVVSFAPNPPFVNPAGADRREGENVYNKATH
jgi:Matrixin